MNAQKAPVRAAVLAADFNQDIVGAMLQAVEEEARSRQVELVRTVRVPGAYELPLVAERMLASRDLDVLVVLGYIERGETLHGEVMGHVVHRALIELSLKYQTPIGLGIIGPGATVEQASTRKHSYGRAALAAALDSLRACSQLPGAR
ncbi:MAG TPA: 6,7-dimethyl-8-ribityllumazine synthase [Polyangiaceae bacterium]|nr:6,7-dimethyl-8-ribityllumazine synthase [Polyangiaceae bacterium]